MAYAGIETMLLTYKMRKADKEFDLMKITNDRELATKKTSNINNDYKKQVAELDQDDPGYADAKKELDDEWEKELAEVSNWEDEVDQKKSDCETEIKQLDGYINSWQTALQQNITKAHTYGPAASGS